jgi:hypothetical protein
MRSVSDAELSTTGNRPDEFQLFIHWQAAAMGYREIGFGINHILNLIDTLPNLKNDPNDSSGTVKLFDGGRLIINTGTTCYEFIDGTTATISTLIGAPLVVIFPNGWEVSVRFVPRLCLNCGQRLRRSAKYCPACGEFTGMSVTVARAKERTASLPALFPEPNSVRS